MNTIIKLITLSILTVSMSLSGTINDSNFDNIYDEASYEIYDVEDLIKLEDSKDKLEMSMSYVRIGAVCNDGWVTSATGSGACSWHQGVNYWLYGWR